MKPQAGLKARVQQKNMPKKSLGRDDWKRRKQIKTILWVVFAAVICGGLVGVAIWFASFKK